MGTYKDRRDEQLAALLEEGRSYQEVAQIADMRVATLKLQIRKKYPELYMRLRGKNGARTTVSEDLEQMRQHALEYRRRQEEIAKRRSDIAEHFFADPLRILQETADEFGVTREYVRQIANGSPGRYAAKKRAKKEILAKKNERPPRFCRTCGAQIQDSRRQGYCDDDHYKVRQRYLRYHVDPGFRERHQRTVARWGLRNTHKLPTDPVERDRLVRYYERVLAGETMEVHGRWLTTGSKAMEAAVRAYREGWAIFKELPEEVQEQVKSEVAAQNAPED